VTTVDKSPTTATRPLPANPLSPATTGSGPSSATSQPTGTLDYDHIRTEGDVHAALPGGVMDPGSSTDHRDEWYFCWKCCYWYKIDIGGHDELNVDDGKVSADEIHFPHDDVLTWDSAPREDELETKFDPIHGENYLRDIENARTHRKASARTHYHEVIGVGVEPSAQTLQRVDLGEDAVKFPHTIPGMDVDPIWLEKKNTPGPTRLFLSCGTGSYIRCESGPVAGQIPSALLKAFIQEKRSNPNIGVTPTESVTQALQLLLTYVHSATKLLAMLILADYWQIPSLKDNVVGSNSRTLDLSPKLVQLSFRELCDSPLC
jgi:hypothetical protein